MPRHKPPIHTRFPVNRQDHTQKGPYLKTILKKMLSGEMPAKDPQTKALLVKLGLKPTIAAWLVLRLCMNGTEGETRAIMEIFDRVDGKMPTPIQNIEADNDLINSELEIVKNGNKPEALERFGRFLG